MLRFGSTNGNIIDTHGLTQDVLVERMPTIYQQGAHASRSTSYRFIATGEVLAVLREMGYVPTQVMRAATRKEDRHGFEKHLVRLRPEAMLGNSLPDVHEIILINSHDGTSSYQLMAGIFRLVCANGCIVGDVEENIRLRHSGRTLVDVVEGTQRIVEGSLVVQEQVEAMRSLRLDRQEQRILSEFTMEARFKPEHGEPNKALKAYRPEDFLKPRRRADVASSDGSRSLYETYQVLQEAHIRGGVFNHDNGTRSREVRSIDETVRVNQAVWKMAQAMRELKH